MNGNPFALVVGQTVSHRGPDHSYAPTKSNCTNLAFLQMHQKIPEEQRNLIEVLISLAKTWYNSPKSEWLFLPAGLIFLCSQRERKRQILAQSDIVLVRCRREVPWEAWLCLMACVCSWLLHQKLLSWLGSGGQKRTRVKQRLCLHLTGRPPCSWRVFLSSTAASKAGKVYKLQSLLGMLVITYYTFNIVTECRNKIREYILSLYLNDHILHHQKENMKL